MTTREFFDRISSCRQDKEQPVIPNSQLWVEPCCHEYGTQIPSLNNVENMQNMFGVGLGPRLRIAIRNQKQELILFDDAKKQRTDLPKNNKVLADWILDCDYMGLPLHWEGIRIKKYGRNSIYVHKAGPRATLWNFQPCPLGKIHNTTLTLRIGGYLLDCWRLSKTTVTPINETTNFLLNFDSYKQHPPSARLSEIYIEYMDGCENLTGTLPVSEVDFHPTIKFYCGLTEKLKRILETNRYSERYQHFLIDLLRNEGRWKI